MAKQLAVEVDVKNVTDKLLYLLWISIAISISILEGLENAFFHKKCKYQLMQVCIWFQYTRKLQKAHKNQICTRETEAPVSFRYRCNFIG